MRSTRTRFTRKIALLTASTVLATGTMLAMPSTASANTGTNDTVTSSEVADALTDVHGNLVAEPVPSKTDADSAAVVKQDGSVTEVPKDPEDGVVLDSKDAPEVTIDLPNADEANDAKRLQDGTVTYPGTDGSAQAVIPTDGGVQMLTTISNADAPTRYDYKVDVPEGGKVQVQEDGSAVVTDSEDKTVLIVPVPWAKDANGTAVPTKFDASGTTLTQVVNHTTGYTYPVVADPRFYWSWGFYVVKFNSAETGYLSRAGAAGIGAYLGGPGAAFFATLGGDWMADWAAARRLCLVYRVNPAWIWASGLWAERC